MDNMLCPDASENITLKGFAGSPDWVSYYFIVEQCKNVSADWICYDQPTIDTFFNNHFLTNDFFKVQLYIVDTVISPSQEDPISYTIEDEIFVTFAEKSGSRGKDKMGSIQIETDDSIWPMSDVSTLSGHYITEYRTQTIELFSSHYVIVAIERDSIVYNVTRAHDKFDNMLSYVGGLFSLLFALIYFFLGSYNEYRYEIAVA